MTTVQLANLAALLLASSSGMGGYMTRSLLAIPRVLQAQQQPADWNPGWGTWFAPGTIVPSYLYNATVPPPYAQTTSNVTVVETCQNSIYGMVWIW